LEPRFYPIERDRFVTIVDTFYYRAFHSGKTANEWALALTYWCVRTKLDDVLGKASVDYELEWRESMSFPAALNRIGLEEEMRPVLDSVVGRENVARLKNAFPFNSDDFAFYQQQDTRRNVFAGRHQLLEGHNQYYK